MEIFKKYLTTESVGHVQEEYRIGQKNQHFYLLKAADSMCLKLTLAVTK